MEKINLSDKLSQFNDCWSPKIIGECNEQLVKLAKVQGDFVWHDHEFEDELFHIISGTLYIEFRDREEVLGPGDILIIPKGVEHRPYTKNNEIVSLLLFEPKSTKHTGDIEIDLTQKSPQYL